MRYLDFELRIERGRADYTARLLRSPAGEAVHAFALPFSDEELEELILAMALPGHLRGGEGPAHLAACRELGGRLFEAVFGPELRACLRSSLEEAKRQGAGLRLRLRLQDAPELADLPWELLYDRSSDGFLAQSNRTPVVRYVEAPRKVPALAVRLPLRVLVLTASPAGLARLDTRREEQLLSQALAPLIAGGRVELERLAAATLTGLQHGLRSREIHVLHYIGHGEFDEEAGEGLLLLEDEQGHADPADAHRLGALLRDHPSLRLAVLNSCEGARNSRTDPFAGVAATLTRQGIPAVVAMQFEISDEAAITLAGELYTALAEGLPVDAAVAEARKAIYLRTRSTEWATPVLYLRATDGLLFDIERARAPRASAEPGSSRTWRNLLHLLRRKPSVLLAGLLTLAAAAALALGALGHAALAEREWLLGLGGEGLSYPAPRLLLTGADAVWQLPWRTLPALFSSHSVLRGSALALALALPGLAAAGRARRSAVLLGLLVVTAVALGFGALFYTLAVRAANGDGGSPGQPPGCGEASGNLGRDIPFETCSWLTNGDARNFERRQSLAGLLGWQLAACLAAVWAGAQARGLGPAASRLRWGLVAAHGLVGLFLLRSLPLAHAYAEWGLRYRSVQVRAGESGCDSAVARAIASQDCCAYDVSAGAGQEVLLLRGRCAAAPGSVSPAALGPGGPGCLVRGPLETITSRCG